VDIKALKTELNKVLPLLVANRDAAYNEWMDGSLARGAFEYVQFRLDSAHAILAREDLAPLVAFNAGAMLTIDLRTAIKDANTPEAKEALASWLGCFQEAGFTHINPVFDIPALSMSPATNYEN